MRTKNTSLIWQHQENDHSVEIDWAPTVDGSELKLNPYELWMNGWC